MYVKIPKTKYSCQAIKTTQIVPMAFYKAMGATETRYSKTTDWTRARGVSLATQTGEYAYNGYYWTRSPDSERPSFVCYASYDGWLKHDYVHAAYMTYRPALTIKIS